MSKPDLSSDLPNYSKTICDLFTLPLQQRKTPPKGKKKRGRNSSDKSPEEREGSKTLRTDDPSPPKVSTNIDSPQPSPPSSPLNSLRPITHSHNQDILSDSLSIHSPLHNQFKATSSGASNSPHPQESNTISQYSPIASPKPQNSSKMSTRPKPLRPLAKELNSIDCVTSQALFKHITKEDGPSTPPMTGQQLSSKSRMP
jgi:hypothetical protein